MLSSRSERSIRESREQAEGMVGSLYESHRPVLLASRCSERHEPTSTRGDGVNLCNSLRERPQASDLFGPWSSGITLVRMRQLLSVG